jgi:hypothetical protein
MSSKVRSDLATYQDVDAVCTDDTNYYGSDGSEN